MGQSTSGGFAIWPVGQLCRAVGEALDRWFNPVSVHGEVTGFARATSGHCYFSLKDADGQLRCAMFRRAASLLDFDLRDGLAVEARGRLGLYGARGDLQLVVESVRPAGQGALYEQFLQRKARLEAQGLFDASRKRRLPVFPRAIGLVTSLGAAALHDVATGLRRRTPHIPVIVAPAAVQGPGAPEELIRSLQALVVPRSDMPSVDLILLVRGGGSIEDLWAFNDEALAHAVVASPVPVVVGVGHETDFTIADFCADLRAPTPTAAAELACASRDDWLALLIDLDRRLRERLEQRLDLEAQRLDGALALLGRPSGRMARQRLELSHWAQRLHHAALSKMQRLTQAQRALEANFSIRPNQSVNGGRQRMEAVAIRLALLDPALVLQRGYAWLSDERGHAMTRAVQMAAGDRVRATLADGHVELNVLPR